VRLVLEGVRIAVGALLANKLRTLLTLLGNIVGIMSVVAVVSLLGGIDNYIRQQVAEEGTTVFSVQRVNFLEAVTDFDRFLEALRHNPRITREDADWLRGQLELAEYVCARATSTARLAAFEKNLGGVEVRGEEAAYPFVENIPLSSGRHVTPLEERESAQVCVIGWAVYEELIAPRAALGQLLRVGGRHFKVVGVAAERGTLLGQTRDRFVVVPLGAYRKVFGPGQSLEIRVRARDVSLVDDAVEEARVAMRVRHGLRPRAADDFAVSTSGQLVDLWKQVSRGVMVALVSLVGISMLVGGIVLMNTMLVSVTERTREIGVRKAIGARRLAIVWQFLVESATLSVLGGLIGMLAGFAIASIVSLATVLPYVVNAAIVLAAFITTVALGLVFGTYPALKAARLDPVEALRSE